MYQFFYDTIDVHPELYRYNVDFVLARYATNIIQAHITGNSTVYSVFL